MFYLSYHLKMFFDFEEIMLEMKIEYVIPITLFEFLVLEKESFFRKMAQEEINRVKERNDACVLANGIIATRSGDKHVSLLGPENVGLMWHLTNIRKCLSHDDYFYYWNSHPDVQEYKYYFCELVHYLSGNGMAYRLESIFDMPNIELMFEKVKITRRGNVIALSKTKDASILRYEHD